MGRKMGVVCIFWVWLWDLRGRNRVEKNEIAEARLFHDSSNAAVLRVIV
ncbi:hypothetical protein Hanom_Chr05g00457981 [Helianthus anomalus]